MEKGKLSGKTILKIVGAFLALAYLGLCLYAGVTGKIPGMHKIEHIMWFGHLKNWVSGGIAASMIVALCVNSTLNDLNLWMWRKKSFFPAFLMGLLPVVAILLLASYLDIGWNGIAAYVVIFAGLCGIAWIPPIMNQVIARQLSQSESASGRQLMRTIEWIHFYPLKKLLVFGLWGFGVVIILRGSWVIATGKLELDGEFLLFMLITLTLVVAFFKKMKRYLCTPYHSVPMLNQILTKSQIEQLMDGEQFERVRFQDIDMNRYLDIYRSQNWMLVNGKLLSKKLALQVSVYSSCGTYGRNVGSWLQVLYLNGMTAKAKVGLYLNYPAYKEFDAVIEELEGHTASLALRKKEDQLAQKFETFFPDCPTEQARVYAFLSQDVTEIRQDYIQTFTSPEPQKKKRSRRKRQ